MTSSNSDPPSIGDLTDGLKQLADSGQPDLKLSAETRDAYLKAIEIFRGALNIQYKAMTAMGLLGSPGLLASAIQTYGNFNLDVNGLEGIEPAMKNYLNYLDEFETTVQKAADRLIGNG
jgi:hypothetical protein